MWKAIFAPRYLGAAAEVVNSDFESRQATLNIKHFIDSLDSENFSELLLNVLNIWNLKRKGPSVCTR